MSVKIRLRRTGKRNAPAHRIVVVDSRSPRDGRFIENIGLYDPRAKIEQIDLARADYWLSQGAQASQTVGGIVKRARDGASLYDRRLQREAEERRKAEEEAAKLKAEAENKKAAEAEAAAAAEQESAGDNGGEEPAADEQKADGNPAGQEQVDDEEGEKKKAEDKTDQQAEG